MLDDFSMEFAFIIPMAGDAYLGIDDHGTPASKYGVYPVVNLRCASNNAFPTGMAPRFCTNALATSTAENESTGRVVPT